MSSRALPDPLAPSAVRARRPALATRAAMLLALVVAGWLLACMIRVADLMGAGQRIPRERIAGAWHRGLLKILGVSIRVTGEPLRTPHLLVSNHVSWLDIPVIGAICPVRFVSRHEVRRWPVAGTFAEACGSLYIERGAGRSHRTAAAMVRRLSSGSVALFPEGTTTDGYRVRPFHARLFQSAIDAGAPVQPLALRYRPAQDGSDVAPFVGDATLMGHLLRVLRAGTLQVELRFLPALHPDDATERRALANQALRHVDRALQAMRRPPPNDERYQ